MFDFSLLIDILFRILNLIVLILLLRYIFKTYILESVKQKIEEWRQQMRSLEEQLLALDHQRDLVISHIDHESKLSIQVRKRVALWAEAVANELKARRREKEQIMRQINAHVLQKEQALAADQMRHAVMRQALDVAQVNLEREFADSKQGAEITSRVMATLRKRVS